MKVSPSDLAVGDIVVVRPGSVVLAADGRIVDGSASMDESMVTGESKSVRREEGDDVVAGTVATDSGLRVEVTAIGDDTALAGIQKLVSDAQNSSSRAQRLADRAAGWLFWFALGAAIVTAIVWALMGRPDDAVVRAITVLVIACPHALGLAIPLVVSSLPSVPPAAASLSRIAWHSSLCGAWTRSCSTRPVTPPRVSRPLPALNLSAIALPMRCWRSRPLLKAAVSTRWRGQSLVPPRLENWTCRPRRTSPRLRPWV